MDSWMILRCMFNGACEFYDVLIEHDWNRNHRCYPYFCDTVEFEPVEYLFVPLRYVNVKKNKTASYWLFSEYIVALPNL